MWVGAETTQEPNGQGNLYMTEFENETIRKITKP